MSTPGRCLLHTAEPATDSAPRHLHWVPNREAHSLAISCNSLSVCLSVCLHLLPSWKQKNKGFKYLTIQCFSPTRLSWTTGNPAKMSQNKYRHPHLRQSSSNPGRCSTTFFTEHFLRKRFFSFPAQPLCCCTVERRHRGPAMAQIQE